MRLSRVATLCMAIGLGTAACDGHVLVVAKVQDARGEPVKGAEITLYANGHSAFQASSDVRGCVTVGGATAPSSFNFNVLVTHPDFSEVSVTVKNLAKHYLVVTLHDSSTGSKSSISTWQPSSENDASPCRAFQ